MKILIVSQYFWPENFKINDLTIELARKGHEITILTGKPNYPEGKFFKGYRFFKPFWETWNDIEICRVPIIPRGNSRGINLLLNYLSFAFFGIILSRYRLRKRNFDLIFVFEISPITVGLPAIWLKNKYKIPIYFWVLDLWPETLYALNIIKSKLWRKSIEWLVRFIYKHCDIFLISSKSFETSLINHGVSKELIHYMPNWAEDVFIREGDFLNKNEFTSFFNSHEDKFKVMFAGNLGESQDIESVLKAVSSIKHHKDIIWLIVGDGRYRNFLEKEISLQGLSDTVYLLGKYPIEEMPYFFSKADAMLVSLKSDPVFSLTVPAKIQTYMASKKPILSMLTGEGNSILNKANCGLICNSGEYLELGTNALALSKISKYELAKLGMNGYNYYLENFNKRNIIENLNELIQRAK